VHDIVTGMTAGAMNTINSSSTAAAEIMTALIKIKTIKFVEHKS